MPDDLESQVRALIHQTQAQARLIEQLRARSPLGFFQRRRLRKMHTAGERVVYLREDALRSENIHLKEKLRSVRA